MTLADVSKPNVTAFNMMIAVIVRWNSGAQTKSASFRRSQWLG
jgi:hypothetical protein